MYIRILEEKVKNNFFSGKIIMILWPRQVGKTTMVKKILWEYPSSDIISFNGDSIEDRENLSINSLQKLGLFVEDKKIIFIDEAQKIENIGNTLKLLIDHYGNTKQIIITGSSSINILDKTNEPLTGRKIVYHMYPISAEEIKKTYDTKLLDTNKESLLVYGSYPQVLNSQSVEKKIEALRELSGASLYRDILEFQQIRNSPVIIKLLKLLALQIGKEVSINELATGLSIDTKTVDKYIHLLENSFLIFRLPPYFTNKRKELNKSNKIYFWDLGIRNTLINDFNSLENRRDTGDLWENFLIVERLKKQSYHDIHCNVYFWRTYNQQEIDYIEESNGKIHAYEFKWWDKSAKAPKSFRETYTESEFTPINKENYLNFIL